MKQFAGFPAKAQYTPIPNIFFSSLLPQLSDITELKVTLHVFEILYWKRGYPRFVAFRELLGNTSLLKSLTDAPHPDQALREALAAATKRGTLLQLTLNEQGTPEDVYFLNNENSRQIITRIQRGELALSGLQAGTPVPVAKEEPPDIFTLYEENIGMLTPLIADELRDAEKLYSAEWVREAVKEAVSNNKRSWKYISRILERWAVEGKSNGVHKRYIKENADPDRYIKGRYGHMVQR